MTSQEPNPSSPPVQSIRVALDTNCLYTTRAGTARYTKGLLAGFGQLGAGAPIIAPLAWPVENLDYRQPMRSLKTAYRELIWCRTRATAQLRGGAYDILHSASHIGFRPPSGVRRVHTLYDLVVLRHPEKFRRWQRFTGVRFLDQLKSMDRIICISRFTADEAMSLLGLPASKLEVVYCGSDLADVPGEAENATGLSLPDTFFLFVGSLEPGKNLALLKSVYQQAAQSGRPLPPLLIAGVRWAGVESEGMAPESWIYLGRVSDSVLVTLYRRAAALVFPSKYEGFGLPVLEAMSLGCPVVCSRSGSIPEVGGNAVCYSELSVPAFLGNMRAMLSDPLWRDEIRAKGVDRASRFSWRQCAEETTAIYESVPK